jgi:branched-subunit amino acid transport protein
VATSTILIVIAGMAVVTYLTRLPLYFLTVRTYRLPPLLDRILERIPAAAFAAIVFPGVLQPSGETDLHWSNLYLYAAAVTLATALLMRRSLLGTILVGIVTATALRQFFG